MTVDIKHDAGCQQTEAALATFTQKWPNFCRYCDAYGNIYYPGNRWEPPSSDLCGHCLESGNCPRCNAPSMQEVRIDDYTSGFYCPVCEWDERVIADTKNPQVGEMVAPIWECLCWMNPENNPGVDV